MNSFVVSSSMSAGRDRACLLGISVVAFLLACCVPPSAASDLIRVQAGSAIPPSAHVALSPGTYSSSQWSLRLTSEDFELRDVDGAVVAAGGYDVQDGMLIMTSSGVDETAEEIRCRVGLFGPGIRLRDEDGTCTDLDGAVLQKEW